MRHFVHMGQNLTKIVHLILYKLNMSYSIMHNLSHLLPQIRCPITLYMAIMVTYIAFLHKLLDDVTMTIKLTFLV